MSRPVCVEIDLVALEHNLNQVRKLAPNSKVWAVVKANGYGHGIERVAKHLTSADGFAVASVDEALALRAEGFTQRILLLEGIFKPEECLQIDQFNLDIAVHSLHQIDWLLQAEFTNPLNIWLKIDTGMHRLGLQPDLVADAIAKLQAKFPTAQLHFMSHFSSSDENNAISQEQIQLFQQVASAYNFPQSLANSAAIQNLPTSHLDWVRPGIMLYGAGLQPDLVASFQPVLTFKTELISLQWIEAGEAVGYNQNWFSERKTLIGVAAVGYGDGYPRHAPNGTPVLINGKTAPLVGRVSMDMITLDLTDLAEEVAIGDEVILWGKNLPVDQIAQLSGTICYELLCGITKRVAILEVNNA